MNHVHPYASSQYAHAFLPLYEPLFLKESQIYILKRPIPDTLYYDAIGCYPLVPLFSSDALSKDFAGLEKQGIVSLVFVSDPFFCPSLATLERVFTHVAAYKEHYVRTLGDPITYSKHHQYEIRRSLKCVEVRRIALLESIDEWMALYQVLMEKHNIRGIQAFTKEYFVALAALEPVMFGAFNEGNLISAHIWFEYESHAYSHLAASNETGYHLRASYAVMDRSVRYFSEKRAIMLDLGAAPDVVGSSSLAFFKEGFSNSSRICYLCKKILNVPLYEKLSAGKNTIFFPAYRG